MFGYYYGFDITYIVLVLPAVLFALWAQMRVSSTFRKYSAARTSRGLTGAQAAEAVLRQNGVYDVRIEYVKGNLTDHYDPKTNVIRLSSNVYSVSSVAAAGVAAHEAGHAVQYAQGYGPIRLRTAIIPICNVGASASWPMVLLGLVFNSQGLLNLGIVLFGLATLFQLVTLPVEFNASFRAIAALGDSGALTASELPAAKKVLRAAALTYVAGLATSLAQLLRLIILFGGRRNDDR